MKKWIMFLSYPGIGILLFITGIEIFRRRKPFDFWLKFLGLTLGLTFLLIFLPLGLINALLVPYIPENSALAVLISGIELIYLYAAGVYICWQQLKIREQFEKSQS